jgi:hypothetical protein
MADIGSADACVPARLALGAVFTASVGVRPAADRAGVAIAKMMPAERDAAMLIRYSARYRHTPS